VSRCIEQANLKADSRILDPFVGCGTTLVESNIRGFSSIGFEAHPFLSEICYSKTLIETEVRVLREIKQNYLSIIPDPDFSEYSRDALVFLKKLIPEQSLEKLNAARKMTFHYPKSLSILLKMILSKVLDLCSFAKTDGIYKAPTSTKKPVCYQDALIRVMDMVIEDLALMERIGVTNRSQVLNKSSEDMSSIPEGFCDLLITSPPYLNNFDFGEMTRMYQYFWLDASSWAEITDKVRRNLVINTTTALSRRTKDVKFFVPESIRQELDSYCDTLLEKKKLRAGKKNYDMLIYPYFSQMTTILRNTKHILKRGATSYWIVGDAALYGVHIRTHLLLSRIMETLGFRDVEIEKLRERGTRWVLKKREGCESGLGEYCLKSRN
jgi:DNA modification methylase